MSTSCPLLRHYAGPASVGLSRHNGRDEVCDPPRLQAVISIGEVSPNQVIPVGVVGKLQSATKNERVDVLSHKEGSERLARTGGQLSHDRQSLSVVAVEKGLSRRIREHHFGAGRTRRDRPQRFFDRIDAQLRGYPKP